MSSWPLYNRMAKTSVLLPESPRSTNAASKASKIVRNRHSDPGDSGLELRHATIVLPMGISRAIAEQMERSSWIRRMFEIGLQLRRERGAENVFDFTLGNPDVEPPEAVIAALRRVVARNSLRSHAYMPNAGYP